MADFRTRKAPKGRTEVWEYDRDGTPVAMVASFKDATLAESYVAHRTGDSDYRLIESIQELLATFRLPYARDKVGESVAMLARRHAVSVDDSPRDARLSRLRAAINDRFADCQERAAHFDQDARIKLKGKDWHGVEDAASDMRDEQARIEVLTWMLGVIDGE